MYTFSMHIRLWCISDWRVCECVYFCDLKRALNRYNFNALKRIKVTTKRMTFIAITLDACKERRGRMRNEWPIVSFALSFGQLFISIIYTIGRVYEFCFRDSVSVWPLIFLSIECISSKFFSTWKRTNNTNQVDYIAPV